MMDSSVHKQLHFKSVNAENRREVEGLTVFSEQAGFIESVSECLRDKRYQGKGYGKQAVLSLLDRLHTEYQSGTVYLSVYENNPHAIKLYQQIGFRFNGKYDSKGEHIMEYHF